MGRTMGNKGKELVKKFEGSRLEAYLCPAGVWTIGYGHTGKVDGKPVAHGMKITQKKAEDLLQADLDSFAGQVESCVKVPLSQEQFDALVSFAYNLGIGNLKNSTLLKLLNQKKYQEAAEQFERWVNAGGRRLEGLVRRREAEKKLFLEAAKKADGSKEKKKETASGSGKGEKKAASGSANKPSNIIDHFTTKNCVGFLSSGQPKYIVIHSTGNIASAKNENANTVNNSHGGVGAHYSVDEKDIYHTLQDNKLIYHCGTAGGTYKQKHPVCRNNNSIGIEMCQKDTAGSIADGTIANTGKLVRYLMKKYQIPEENVLRHYDVVSKQCPIAYAGSAEKDKKWKQLKLRLLGKA